MSDEQPVRNTDRELWRESDDRSQCTPSIHVTQDGGIGINVAGTVRVRTLREWHGSEARNAALAAECERLKKLDDPEFDATDAAHPAWWRGHDHTTIMFCQHVNEILDGKECRGQCTEPWESTRQRLHDLRTQLAAAKVEGEEWKAESERRGRELQVQVINCRELHEIIEKQKTELATARLHVSTLSEACVASDSFGVEGSSFNHCMVCNGGGSPYVKFEHDAKCPVLLAEGKAAEWLEEIRADELASMERSEKLEKELAAAQKTIDDLQGREGRLREALKAAHDLLDQHMAGMVRMGHKMRSEGKLTAANEENMATEIADVDRVKAIFPLTAALAATDGGAA